LSKKGYGKSKEKDKNRLLANFVYNIKIKKDDRESDFWSTLGNKREKRRYTVILKRKQLIIYSKKVGNGKIKGYINMNKARHSLK
jgi:hypothetical protein